MKIVLFFLILSSILMAEDSFGTLEAETIGFSIVALFIYIVVRLKMIMTRAGDNKKCKKS